MKTILQIAKEIGVSKQAVYKRYKGKLYNELYPYIHTKDGTTYILEQGEDILRMDFFKNGSISDIYTEVHTEHIQDIPPDIVSDIPKDIVTDNLIQMLQKELELKNQLIIEQQQTIRELTATIKTQADSISVTHQNELAETIIDGQQKLMADEKKQSFFRRIFSKRN